MGISEFAEIVRLKNELAAAEARAAAYEQRLRNVVRYGVRGNCPPEHGCGRSGGRNCEACWLTWLGISPSVGGGILKRS